MESTRQFKDTEFSAVSNTLYYVDYSKDGPHYKHNAISKTDYLWTKHISYCVVIGLLEYENDKIRKIGLYHSVSEHGPISLEEDTKNNYIRESFISFLNGTNPRNVRIVIGYNKDCITSDTVSGTKETIAKLLNSCCQELRLPNIAEENYKNHLGDSTFFITANGECGNLSVAAELAILDIQGMFLDFLENNSSNDTINTIIKIDTDEIQSITDLKKIKSLASNYLLNSNRLALEEEILFLKTIAWDPILKTTSEYLLNDWLNDHKEYQMSIAAKKAFLGDCFDDDNEAYHGEDINEYDYSDDEFYAEDKKQNSQSGPGSKPKKW